MCVLGAVACCAATINHEVLPSFTSFIQRYGRKYSMNTEEYVLRQNMYESRLQHVHQQNNQPQRLWDAAVNHLTDRTEHELSQLRGLRVMKSSDKAPGLVGVHKTGGFLEVRSPLVPEEISWAHLNAVTQDVDQGGCGSCWAFATSVMLQANAEIHGLNRTFSAQELVNCVPNPHRCGGEGGCTGGTVELGMNWIMEKGLATEASTPYQAMDDVCSKPSASLLSFSDDNDGKHLAEMIAVGFHPADKAMADFPTLQGWERLPENEYLPLLNAVATRGPVAVSVGAGLWEFYGTGIWNSCSKDSTINHAVTLIGYGTDKDKKKKYWQIKNSWSTSWGEGGNMRLLREEGDNAHCGTDHSPKDGTGCDNAPSTVRVCGMCGILYDAAYPMSPKFVGKNEGGVYFAGQTPQPLAKQRKTLKIDSELPLR